jgi:hypothetical protein
LDLRLLVDAQDDRVLGRIQIQPDDIFDLGSECRVTAHLARPHEMRLESVDAQDFGNRRAGQLELAPKQTRSPACPPRWRRRQRLLNDLLDGLWRNRMVFAPCFRLLSKALDAALEKSRPDARHLRDREGRARCDFHIRQPVSTQQYDARSAHVSGQSIALPNHLLQRLPLRTRQYDWFAFALQRESHYHARWMNPPHMRCTKSPVLPRCCRDRR